MKNRDIYLKDPSTRKLVNEGVASVNDEKTAQAMAVLRYELETFVCDGQYQKGMEHILETYLKNLDQAQQPAVWISGFYGSGKSHLVKMMRALWEDTRFDDGATASGIANLPQTVKDLLKELKIQGKKFGGLHAVSGTLGSGASGSVRLALLRIIFKSVDLPEHYPIARFVMWLKNENMYNEIKSHVENNGYDWQEELDNFYVAEGLHGALVAIKPTLFSSPTACVDTLNNLYPDVRDVSIDDMTKAIRKALTNDKKFPLTLIVLDEVQQYIGDDSQRSMDVQDTVEACCKNIGSKLLFIGTGQTAVTGTSNLKKLEGRFTIRIELSDTDVDAVIRQVILGKKPDAISPIENVMQKNLGEVSRHLGGTNIGHRQDDVPFFALDYPVLPVRRRFWERTLRVLDQTGTDSQLRSQLSMIHKAVQTNLEEPLGSVIPSDFLYFDLAYKLLQARILPRKVHDKTMAWITGTEEQKLLARAVSLIFLINKLTSDNKEVGIKATIDTIVDLMVEDLSQGSSTLRGKLPSILEPDKCDHLLMKVGDEYRIQTEESSAWNDEFLSQKNALNNETYRIETERDERIRKKFGELVKKLSVSYGESKVNRDLFPIFDSECPKDANQKVYIWVRDGWSVDENSVRADARQAGNQSPTIFVFIPKRSADDLRYHLIEYKAAAATLERRGVPGTAEGKEARSAMETTKQTAEGKINELLGDAFSGTRIFQAGGNEIIGNQLQDIILEAASNSLQRLYPHFHVADHSNWDKVYTKAKQGAPDALKAVGDEGEPGKNPVCKAIMAMIAGGKSGSDIRNHFEGPDYGWSRDAVDGALQTLLIAGLIKISKVNNSSNNLPAPTELDRKTIGKTEFKIESATVTTAQRIQIRKLLQKVSIQVKQGEELGAIPSFLHKLNELADQAGGDPPKPEKPDVAFLEEIRLTSGNEQLLSIFNKKDEIQQAIENWNTQAKGIAERIASWNKLERLCHHAKGLADSDVILTQVEHIRQNRQLLEPSDLIAPLVASLTQLLRDELNKLKTEFDINWDAGGQKLELDENWRLLDLEQKHELRLEQQLVEALRPKVNVESTDEIISTLNELSLSAFRDRVIAMPSRFDQIILDAAKLTEPDIQQISLPSQTLKSEQDVDEWLKKVRQLLIEKLANGPIIPH